MPKKSGKKLHEKSDSKTSYDKKSSRKRDIENNYSAINKRPNDFLQDSRTLMSDTNTLTGFSNGIAKKSTAQRRKTLFEKIEKTDRIVEETPTSSLASGVAFYCSQNLYESVVGCNPDIMQSIVPSVVTKVACYSQSKISPCSTSPTIDGLGVSVHDAFADNLKNLKYYENSNQSYIMTQLYNSQIQSSRQNILDNVQNEEYVMTQLYDSNSFMPPIQQNSLSLPHQNRANNNKKHQNFNLDQSTLAQNTDSNHREKNTFETVEETYYDNTCAIVEDNFISSDTATSINFSLINNPPTELIIYEATNTVFNQQKLSNEHLVSDSFPSTPVDADPLILPPTLLLSNYCSEYDKAYTMKDLKPNQYRNYRHNESLRSLKEYLDLIIPFDRSLKVFHQKNDLP